MLGPLPDAAGRLLRLRIVVGVLLALGIGALGPTCYSSSVRDERIQPLLVDLSTARAHGHLLQGSASYRSPAEIEEELGRIKSRYGIYTFLMWLVVSGAVGYAWFTFTRKQ